MRADDPAIVAGGAEEIERRLDTGESIGVHTSPGVGWPLIATGTALFVVYGVGLALMNAIMSGGAVVLAAIFVIPFMLLFLGMVWRGVALLNSETTAYELTPEGITDWSRPGAAKFLPWKDILAADLEKGVVRLELHPEVSVPRIERWAMRNALRRTGAGFYPLPARQTTIDENTVTEVIERRVTREMLKGTRSIDRLPDPDSSGSDDSDEPR